MAPAASPPKILVTSVFGYQNRGDWQLAISLFRLLDQTFPGCRIDALCRDPGTQSAWFPNVTFHQLLGVSFRPPGLSRLLESALGFALNLLSTAFAIVTGVGSTRLSRLYREADIVIAAPGGYLADTNTRLWRNLMRSLLARVEAVCARDEVSSELVKELGSDGRLRIVPDMALQDDSLDLDAAQSELEFSITTTCVIFSILWRTATRGFATAGWGTEAMRRARRCRGAVGFDLRWFGQSASA